MKLEIAQLFFIDKMDIQPDNILEIRQILTGCSNNVYYIITKSNTYYMRLAIDNPLIERIDEKLVLDQLKSEYVYYDENGNYIRLWINAIYNTYWNEDKIIQISELLKTLHNIKLPNLTKFNYTQYEKYIKHSKYKKCYALYIALLNKYKSLPLCVCHNDLNPTNILQHNNKIIIVDYERVQLNTVYFDLANLAREDMTIEQIKYLCKYNDLDFNIFLDHLIITSIYGLQWTLCVGNDRNLKTYQENTLQRLIIFLKMTKYEICV